MTIAQSDGAAQKRNPIMDMPDTAPAASTAEPPSDLTVALPDGRLLGYAEYGDPAGTPIFGLHGTPGSRFMFRLAHPVALALGVRLLAPERPGFGISTYQPGRTLASYAIDIADFADALGIRRFAVAGVSGGGPYAAACATLLPDRVTALGLISPVGPMAGAGKPRSIGKGHYFAFRVTPRVPPLLAAVFTFGRYAFLYAPNAIYGFLMRRASPSDWKILSRAEVRRNLLQGVAEGCRPGIGAGMQEMVIFSRPWDVPFQAIEAPAFLWQGMADRNVSIAASLSLAELVPNCQTRRIENAGHYWIFDNIAEVLETLVKAARGSSVAAGQPATGAGAAEQLT
jgi:pimeloyl-ACP methyl ester carboxylesterase